MSTSIPDTDLARGPHVLTASAQYVRLAAQSPASVISAVMPRADFIAAVETELGVIVIDRAELPEVVWSRGMKRWETIPDERGIWAEVDADPAYYEKCAEEYLAMAAHLRAQPPVDEAKVAALANIIAGLDGELVADDLARDLLATGRVDVKDAS